MYFWNIKKLKADLKDKPLTEKQILPYVIATLVLYYLSAVIAPVSSDRNGILETSLIVLSIVIGTYWLFKKNHADAGQYFIQRFFAIGWVASIRFGIFSLVISVLLYASSILKVDTASTSNAELIIESILIILGYWYIGTHITEVANEAK